MTSSSFLRAPVVALTLAAFVASSIAVTPAIAGSRRDDAAAAIAIGVGALVIGGILASKARKARQRERAYHQDYDYVQPRYRSYRHQQPSHYRRGRNVERFND